MGWSEKYWEDVESELEQSAISSESTSEDGDLDHSAPGLAAPRLAARGPAALDPPVAGRSADPPELG